MYLLEPGILLEEVGAGESFVLVGDPAMTEVEAMGDQAAPGSALGKLRQGAVVFVAFEPMADHQHAARACAIERGQVGCADDRLTIRAFDHPVACAGRFVR